MYVYSPVLMQGSALVVTMSGSALSVVSLPNGLYIELKLELSADPFTLPEKVVRVAVAHFLT